MSELSGRVAAPSNVRTHGNGNDPRQAAMGLFFGTQAAEPFTLQESITVHYDPGTGLTSDPIPVGNQARLWQGGQASSDSANLVLLNNLTTFYKVFTLPGSLQLYAAAQQDYPAITETTIPLWDTFGRNWRRSQFLKVSAAPPIVPIYGLWFSNQSADTIEIQSDDLMFLLAVVTNSNLSGATYPVIRRFGNYIWITNLPNNTIVILNLDGTGFGTILDVSSDLDSPVTFCEVSGKVWVFTRNGNISVFAHDGTPDATPTLTPTGYAAPNAPSFAQHIGTKVWLTNAGTGVTVLIADDGSAAVLTLSGIVGKGVAQVGSDEVWVGADSPGTIKRFHVNGTAYGGADIDVLDAFASLMDIVVTDTYIYVLNNADTEVYQFDLTGTLITTFTGLDFLPFSAAWVHA